MTEAAPVTEPTLSTAAPAEPVQAAEPAPAAPAIEQAAAPAEPNIIQLALAAAKSKSALIRDRDEAQQIAEQRQALVEELNGKLTAAITERDEARQALADATEQLAQVRTALTSAQAEQSSATAEAVEIVANLGISTETLPAQSASGETIEDLEARLADTKDPREKYELAKKINAALGTLN
jgi:chromosome condensin MukBEF ATPase and DNA-binding subunit MukB